MEMKGRASRGRAKKRQRQMGAGRREKDSAGRREEVCARGGERFMEKCLCERERERAKLYICVRVCVCVRACVSAECNKRRSYSVRGRGGERWNLRRSCLRQTSLKQTFQRKALSSFRPLLPRVFQPKIFDDFLASASSYVLLVKVNVYRETLTVHQQVSQDQEQQTLGCM